MLQSPSVPRLHSDEQNAFHYYFHQIYCSHCKFAPTLILFALMLAFVLPAAPVTATPSLSLPIPSGESWKIIQGYGCGTHNSWDRYSLDLVNSNGRTFGAPVRAAADGTIWSWTSKSGTLILAHGGGFYTMYTHLDRAVSIALDRAVKRGDVIGYAGDRAAHGLAHLHFTAFTGHGIAASGRQSVPLSFNEGYDLPDTGGCNQHGGEVLTTRGAQDTRITSVQFSTTAQPEHWYNSDMRIEFRLPDDVRGFSQGWDTPPTGDVPQFGESLEGYVQTVWAGEGLHTLYIRYWDAAGTTQTASFGPVGYDTTAPAMPAPLGEIALHSGQATTVRWQAATDNGAGVAGYEVYIGTDPNGTADAMVATPETSVPALLVGSYVLRVQALDYAGNASAWQTLGMLTVNE